jgi:hypothetical protein
MGPRFPKAPRLLPDGGTVLILGSGPSLTQADVDYARARVDCTIAINDSYVFATDAEVLWAGDDKWMVQWHHGCSAPHIHNFKSYPAFDGQFKFCLSPTPYADVITLGRGPLTGLCLRRDRVALGGNGCHQSINLAVHLGATRIVLLGVDMKAGKVFRDGAWRQSDHFAWLGRHADDTKPYYREAISYLATLVQPLNKLGIEVINCTPDSALTCFQMRPLRDVFPMEATG